MNRNCFNAFCFLSVLIALIKNWTTEREIEFVTGDGTLGYETSAPYDGIIVTAAAPLLPQPLYDQLKPGGRMVIPIGDEKLQRLKLIEKPYDGTEPKTRTLCGCRFVKLIGEAGW